MMEAWKPVVGWEEFYEVSDVGRVRRKANSPCRYKTEKILNPKELKSKGPQGYLQVTLKNDRRGVETLYVHRLVCEAFHGSPTSSLLKCCHNDGNRHNNTADNLRWDTKEANEADRIKHGTSNRGQQHGLSKLTEDQVLEIRRLSSAGLRQQDIADQFGVSQAAVSDIKLKRRWAHL